MLSILSLFVVLALSILVTRIASVALTYTGLARESAKFQARSAFTGVGFTTSESEKVVNHPIRRRILLLLMMLGNAGVITAVSSLILSFVNVESSNKVMTQVLLIVTGVVVIWALASSNWLDRHLNNLISTLLKKYSNINVKDYARLLHLSGDYQVTELQAQEGDWLCSMSLGRLKLREEGLVVLGVTRKNGDYLGVPDGETRINPQDTLIIYGRADNLEALDKRREGAEGNKEHDQGEQEQDRIKEEEKKRDVQNDR
jgi:K+/H+ antiporter YhaU regulatory subunit KhtT